MRYHNGIPWPDYDPDPLTHLDIPLLKVSAMSDMDYLDHDNALPIWQTQADIIIDRNIKTIVDAGCRHGPILRILRDRNWITPDFRYMGFDTSPEPIELAELAWRDYDNIEFRVADWDNMSDIVVPWDVDCVIWSATLLYAGARHREVFNRVTRRLYDARYAIIQEPLSSQRPEHIIPGQVLKTIQPEISTYSDMCEVMQTEVIECDIFCGTRMICLCSM